MRSRPNAASRSVEAFDGVRTPVQKSTQEEVDSNGKDRPKFKRPPKPFAMAMAMPPPPKLAPLTVRDAATAAPNGGKSVPEVHVAVIAHDGKRKEHDGIDDIAPNGNGMAMVISSSNSTLTPAPPVPIPSLPSSTTTVYQRANRKPPTSNNVTTASDTTATSASGTTNITVNPKASISSDNYSNAYPTHPAHQLSKSQISHPYKPTSWYADSLKIQKGNQVLKAIFSAVGAIFFIAFLWWGYQQRLISLQSVGTKRHHKNYHHHDVHQDFHPMMGIVESPFKFAPAPRRIKRSYRQLEQEPASSHDQTPRHRDELSHARTDVFEQTHKHDIFSTFPVKTLSDRRLLPYVGFGVTSRSVEHKQIPIIVSTLLQYASSETEGGGGIALIDAVIDEDSTLEQKRPSPLYSINNKIAKRYEEEEEKLESSMAKTAVALVGRAIAFFGKEKNKGSVPQNVVPDTMQKRKPSDYEIPYDYENRLEVHLVVGLAGPDLGAENTIVALQQIVAELDGLVRSFPKHVFHSDASEWAVQPSSLTFVDRHVDVRLHVLLRLNHCHDSSHALRVVPCSSDESQNKEHLNQFIDSYRVLEKLYKERVIHGMGLDGSHGLDIGYLVERCTIKPQLYRGDVYQALDVLRTNHRSEKDEHIASTLKEHNISFLASNVAGHILERKPMAPNAYALLQNLGGVLYRAHHEMLNARAEGDVAILSTAGQNGEGQYYTVPRIVLSYLVRNNICVLPHAYKAEHLADDAPEWVGGLANFLTERRAAEIGMALRALLSEEDIREDHGMGMEGENGVAVVFHNMLVQEVQIFMKLGNKEESVSGGAVKKGNSIMIIANTGEKFSAYGEDGQKRGDYMVTAKAGGLNDFTIPSS